MSSFSWRKRSFQYVIDEQLQAALTAVFVDVEPIHQTHFTIGQRRVLVNALEVEGDGIEGA